MFSKGKQKKILLDKTSHHGHKLKQAIERGDERAAAHFAHRMVHEAIDREKINKAREKAKHLMKRLRKRLDKLTSAKKRIDSEIKETQEEMDDLKRQFQA